MECMNVHVTGCWFPQHVLLRWGESTYRSTPEIDRLIELAWQQAKLRLGDKLFDGPMCRLESFECRSSKVDCRNAFSTVDNPQSTLVLSVSRTSYRIFLGTNMSHPELADTHGQAVMANPVGVSTALITADNFLMLGRRSDQVAYYPHMLHPFAGSLEPSPLGEHGDPPDLFAEARRELHEELGLDGDQLGEWLCLGIVEDARLRHPETILSARSTLTRSEVENRLLGHEHTDAWSCPATAAGIAAALEDRSMFTPVAQATLELYANVAAGAI